MTCFLLAMSFREPGVPRPRGTWDVGGPRGATGAGLGPAHQGRGLTGKGLGPPGM